MLSISQLFIGTAYAQDTQAAAPAGLDSSMLMNYLPLLLIFGVFYVLIIRPQQRKVDEQARMLKALQKGDVVVTSSGIYGKVVRMEGLNDVILEIADGVQVKLVRQCINGLAVNPAAEATEQAGKK